MNLKKMNLKSMAVLGVICALLGTTALGTVAWLTATDDVTNTFTVGNITEPEVGPTDPVNPDPDNPQTPDVYDPEVDGNIFEPYWVDQSKLVPGYSISKDPYVGIGKGSEDSYVFVNVENNFGKNVYFAINSGWTAVEANGVILEGEKYFSGGLFKYNTVLQAFESDSVWTSTALFSEVIVDADVSAETLEAVTDKEITVSCFIHQANNEAGDDLSSIAEEAAKAHFASAGN